MFCASILFRRARAGVSRRVIAHSGNLEIGASEQGWRKWPFRARFASWLNCVTLACYRCRNEKQLVRVLISCTACGHARSPLRRSMFLRHVAAKNKLQVVNRNDSVSTHSAQFLLHACLYCRARSCGWTMSPLGCRFAEIIWKKGNLPKVKRTAIVSLRKLLGFGENTSIM